MDNEKQQLQTEYNVLTEALKSISMTSEEYHSVWDKRAEVKAKLDIIQTLEHRYTITQISDMAFEYLHSRSITQPIALHQFIAYIKQREKERDENK